MVESFLISLTLLMIFYESFLELRGIMNLLKISGDFCCGSYFMLIPSNPIMSFRWYYFFPLIRYSVLIFDDSSETLTWEENVINPTKMLPSIGKFLITFETSSLTALISFYDKHKSIVNKKHFDDERGWGWFGSWFGFTWFTNSKLSWMS